jgi:hypothetical protein
LKQHLLIWICLLSTLGLSSPSLAGMRWSARAIDPSLIDAIKSDSKLLERTLFEDPPEIVDTKVDLDKAWHGIHYLLTGRAEPDGSLATKVIWGSEDIGPTLGYGPARLLKPDEVKAIAKLLQETAPDMLRKRYKPKEMTGAVYPDVIWERDGDDALRFLLDYYVKLVAFYKLAAERGQAVILAIT